MPFLSHLPELMIVMVLALLIFGPKRLPEMGNAIGKTIIEFRKTMTELKRDHASEHAALPPASTTETSVTE
jgi:sec-independent protein translocase protein TatA